MSVRVVDNTVKIKFQMDTGVNLALRLMLNDIEKTAFKNTPKNKGNLRRDILKTVVAKKGTIIWGKNYAVYQETKQFKNYTTPGTGPHFAERAVKKVADNYREYLKKANVLS